LAEAAKYSVKDEDKVAVARLRFQAYAGQKLMAEAKQIVDALLKDYPNRGDVYMTLAEYYLRLTPPDVAEAAKALEVGVTKEFDDDGIKGQMYLTLSRLRLSQRDVAGALAAAESALATDPFNGAFTDQYALCYEANLATTGAPRP
jgi:predicted Zn-dependent protease